MPDRQAWKFLALRLHPDKNPDKSEKGQAAYARVQKAYELLTDKAARAALDDLHRSGSGLEPRVVPCNAEQLLRTWS